MVVRFLTNCFLSGRGINKVIMLLICLITMFIGIIGIYTMGTAVAAPIRQVRTGTPGEVPAPQQNNQTFIGKTSSNNNVLTQGSNQGNTGNQGLNHGFSQDNSLNAGNQLSSQRKNIAYQENNQYLAGDGSGSGGNNATFVGNNQGNSGNEGINTGFNQDNAGNSGNQVNNQGNVIGTQINNQGTDVNNNGSLIENQVNYINLLPTLHANANVRTGSRPQLTLGAGLGR